MGNARILLQLDQAGPLPADVISTLEDAGAAAARPSHPQLPGLYVSEVPEGVDVNQLLSNLNQLASLRYAEAETFSQAF
ncbi:MAG: hypothetical protein ACKOYK_04145 [Cyanobium sp.]